MYSFDSEGYLQTEKCLHFVRSYFERCKADYSTHEIVLILYARVYYPQASTPEQLVELAREYSGLKDLTAEQVFNREGAY